MSHINRKLVKFVLSSVLIFGSISLLLGVLIDPEDYVDDIETIAEQNGLKLSLNGEISLHSFPRLGVSAQQVSFSFQDVDQGIADEVKLSLSWLGLFGLPSTIQQLPLDSIRVQGARLRYANDKFVPLQIENININVSNISLDGGRGSIDASAQLLSDLEIRVQGDFMARVDNQRMNRVRLFDMQFTADQLVINAAIDANFESSTVSGNFWASELNLQRQLKAIQLRLPIFSLPMMSSKQALTDVDFNSEFSRNSNGYSTYTHQLSIDNQTIDLFLESDQHSGVMATTVTAERFNLGDYLADDLSSTSPLLLTPLALPFLLWGGENQIKLSVDEIVMPEFSLYNLYTHLSGTSKALRLTSLNGDVFGGQINLSALINRNETVPKFSLRGSAYGINLEQLNAVADADNTISGELSGDISIEGSGTGLVDIQTSLTGSAQLSVKQPSFTAINIEESICQASALFSGTDNTQGVYTTPLDPLYASVEFDQGKMKLTDLRSGLGNLKLSGNGSLEMLLQRYELNLNARIEGPVTSSNGCAIDETWWNRDIPFVCSGDYSPTTTQAISCGPGLKLTLNLPTTKSMQKHNIGEKFALR